MVTDQETWISGYRLMWAIIMFDSPVRFFNDRQAATKFRDYLLDEGFSMGQYSIYYRLLPGKESVESLKRRIRHNLPAHGVVQILVITDKQYENIQTFRSRKDEPQKKAEQLLLF